MSDVRLLDSSLRWTPEEGYFLLEAHLARLGTRGGMVGSPACFSRLGYGGAEFILRRAASDTWRCFTNACD